jgi:hypothetical protein
MHSVRSSKPQLFDFLNLKFEFTFNRYQEEQDISEQTKKLLQSNILSKSKKRILCAIAYVLFPDLANLLQLEKDLDLIENIRSNNFSQEYEYEVSKSISQSSFYNPIWDTGAIPVSNSTRKAVGI